MAELRDTPLSQIMAALKRVLALSDELGVDLRERSASFLRWLLARRGELERLDLVPDATADRDEEIRTLYRELHDASSEPDRYKSVLARLRLAQQTVAADIAEGLDARRHRSAERVAELDERIERLLGWNEDPSSANGSA